MSGTRAGQGDRFLFPPIVSIMVFGGTWKLGFPSSHMLSIDLLRSFIPRKEVYPLILINIKALLIQI